MSWVCVCVRGLVLVMVMGNLFVHGDGDRLDEEE